MELSIVGIEDTSERLEKHSHVQTHITVMKIRMENTQLIEVNWLRATTLARKLNQSTPKNHQPVSTTLHIGRRSFVASGPLNIYSHVLVNFRSASGKFPDCQLIAGIGTPLTLSLSPTVSCSYI